MKKLVLLIISLINFVGVSAQRINLHCETAGTLSDSLSQ